MGGQPEEIGDVGRAEQFRAGAFGRQEAEVGVGQEAGEQGGVGLFRRGQRAVLVIGQAEEGRGEAVQNQVAGAGVEGQGVRERAIGRQKRDVGDAA